MMAVFLVDAIPVVEYTSFDAFRQLADVGGVTQAMQNRLFFGQNGQKALASRLLRVLATRHDHQLCP